MKTKFALLSFLFCTLTINAQQILNNKLLTGSLSTDSKIVLDDYKAIDNPGIVLSSENKKSPFLAGVMSLVIPGSGEIYAGEYIKAGIFVAIEAAVITTAIIYDGKGDDKTTEFQNYADDYTNPDHNWSVVRYAQWLIDSEGADPNIRKDNLAIDDTQLPPWERVDWNLLNTEETGSHKLPIHGEQQYYELIGKYNQYSSGWNDFVGPTKEDISPNYLFYAGMRGDANDFYSVAKTAVIGIYLNHFLSGLDAVWSTVSFNKNLAVKVRMENIQLADHAEFYPKFYLSYNF
jgi:hypothetical protein